MYNPLYTSVMAPASGYLCFTVYNKQKLTTILASLTAAKVKTMGEMEEMGQDHAGWSRN